MHHQLTLVSLECARRHAVPAGGLLEAHCFLASRGPDSKSSVNYVLVYSLLSHINSNAIESNGECTDDRKRQQNPCLPYGQAGTSPQSQRVRKVRVLTMVK
jgi:hypothetical protein